VQGSRTEGGIVVGGGPAIVPNNIAVRNANGGISAQNYGGRNLQHDIWIVHNTLIDNRDSGINTHGWSTTGDNVIANNAVLPRSRTPLIRPNGPAGTVVGNVSCTAACFVNAPNVPYDFWPAPRSRLIGAAKNTEARWKTSDDFMREPRDRQPDV